MDVLEILGVISLCLYGLLFIGCIVSFLLSFNDKKSWDPTQTRIQQLFHAFLGSFIAVRITWYALRSFAGRTVASFILNRLGFVLFFTAFTLVLFFWAEMYHKNYVSAGGFLPRLFKVFVAVNALLYAIEISVVVTFLIVDRDDYSQREGNPIYDASIYLEIIVNFVVSMCFLIYGIRLFLSHVPALEYEETQNRKYREILKILISTIIFTTCFLVRVVAFLYRPITNSYMNNNLFQILAYYIPEVIPSLVQFYLIRGKLRREKADTQYIQNLYQQEEDSRQFETPTPTPYDQTEFTKLINTV